MIQQELITISKMKMIILALIRNL